MNSVVPIFVFESLLIESQREEDEEQFHAYLTELLVEIYSQMPKWLQFKIGGHFERNGTLYRSFLCPAGSVASNIQLLAQRPGGISRRLILRGRRADSPCCIEVSSGIENEFDCNQLRQII